MSRKSRLTMRVAELIEQRTAKLERWDNRDLEPAIVQDLMRTVKGDEKKDVEGDADLEAEVYRLAVREGIARSEKPLAPRGSRTDGQGSLFSDAAILVIGESERVKMGAARHRDLLARDRVITRNMKAQTDAYYEEHTYLMERVEVAATRPDDPLRDIERDTFGWTPPD